MIPVTLRQVTLPSITSCFSLDSKFSWDRNTLSYQWQGMNWNLKVSWCVWKFPKAISLPIHRKDDPVICTVYTSSSLQMYCPPVTPLQAKITSLQAFSFPTQVSTGINYKARLAFMNILEGNLQSHFTWMNCYPVWTLFFWPDGPARFHSNPD